MANDVAHLTQRRITELEPQPGRQYVVWDSGNIPGFGVRVSGTVKAFVLTYRIESGRARWATLGRFGVLTLEQARVLAREYLGIVAGGEDPLRRKDLARTAPTLGEIADRFLHEHVAVRLKPDTGRLYRTAVSQHIRPAFGAVAIADVTRADVVRLHHHLRPTPIMANRVLQVLSSLCSWAERQEYLEARANPCQGVKKFPEEKRQRYLTPDELRRLGAAFRIAERWHRMSPTVITALKLLLLTGARRSEILKLRWREVDLAKGVLRLP